MFEDQIAKIDPNSKALSFNEKDLSEHAKAMEAKTPEDAAAKEAALGIAGRAAIWFQDKDRDWAKLKAAHEAKDFEQFVKKSLEDPSKAEKTAHYLEVLSNSHIDGGYNLTIEMGFLEHGSRLTRDFPGVSFSVDEKGNVSQICFGDAPYNYKGRFIPYRGICAEK